MNFTARKLLYHISSSSISFSVYVITFLKLEKISEMVGKYRLNETVSCALEELTSV